MGNEILKKYSIKETPLFQTGFMGLWNVYQGIKKSTKEQVCIFIIAQLIDLIYIAMVKTFIVQTQLL